MAFFVLGDYFQGRGHMSGVECMIQPYGQGIRQLRKKPFAAMVDKALESEERTAHRLYLAPKQIHQQLVPQTNAQNRHA